nr:hypothetical protein CFP56_65493 [Quercus suber]
MCLIRVEGSALLTGLCLVKVHVLPIKFQHKSRLCSRSKVSICEDPSRSICHIASRSFPRIPPANGSQLMQQKQPRVYPILPLGFDISAAGADLCIFASSTICCQTVRLRTGLLVRSGLPSWKFRLHSRASKCTKYAVARIQQFQWSNLKPDTRIHMVTAGMACARTLLEGLGRGPSAVSNPVRTISSKDCQRAYCSRGMPRARPAPKKIQRLDNITRTSGDATVRLRTGLLVRSGLPSWKFRLHSRASKCTKYAVARIQQFQWSNLKPDTRIHMVTAGMACARTLLEGLGRGPSAVSNPVRTISSKDCQRAYCSRGMPRARPAPKKIQRLDNITRTSGDATRTRGNMIAHPAYGKSQICQGEYVYADLDHVLREGAIQHNGRSSVCGEDVNAEKQCRLRWKRIEVLVCCQASSSLAAYALSRVRAWPGCCLLSFVCYESATTRVSQEVNNIGMRRIADVVGEIAIMMGAMGIGRDASVILDAVILVT